MRGAWCAAALALLVVGCAAAPRSRGDTAPRPHSGGCDEGRLCIVVHDADALSYGISNATVWVLARDGRRLSEGMTRPGGIAHLDMPLEEDEPAYVLVDAEGYFVGGLRWNPGQREYYIELTIAAVL